MSLIYLDNAATSFPKPDSVAERVGEVLRDIGGNPGRGSHRMALEAGRVVFKAREGLGSLLGLPDASRIAFTKNATEAINIALKGLLNPGDHVVTTAFEHNSVARTLRGLEETGVKVTKVSGTRPDLVRAGDIEGALTKETRLVAVVHASNVFGTLEPIEEIGALLRKRGIPLMVDAAQTVGAVPIDVHALKIDILVGTGHKALLGPQGTGFVYFREGIEVAPLVDGGTGELDDTLELPERLEAGTINTPGIGGLGAGIDFILEQGLQKIRAHESALTGALLRGLKSIHGVRVLGTEKPSERSSLVTFNMDDINPEDIGARLDREFEIIVRCGIHCSPDAHLAAGTHPYGAVRVSPGYFNTPADIESLLDALREIKGA